MTNRTHTHTHIDTQTKNDDRICLPSGHYNFSEMNLKWQLLFMQM